MLPFNMKNFKDSEVTSSHPVLYSIWYNYWPEHQSKDSYLKLGLKITLPVFPMIINFP